MIAFANNAFLNLENLKKQRRVSSNMYVKIDVMENVKHRKMHNDNNDETNDYASL